MTTDLQNHQAAGLEGIARGPELFWLEAWVADNPGSRMFIKLARSYREAGRLDEAVEVLERGIVLRPGEIMARELLAEILTEQGKEDEALEHLLKAARELARHAGVFKRLGDLYESRGRLEEAANARGLAGRLVRGPDEMDAARELIRELAGPPGGEAPPDNLTASSQETATMAEIYAKQGHLAQARDIYRKLAGQHPELEKYKARLAELEELARTQENTSDAAGALLTRLTAFKQAAMQRAGA